jgi:hypothetical protein
MYGLMTRPRDRRDIRPRILPRDQDCEWQPIEFWASQLLIRVHLIPRLGSRKAVASLVKANVPLPKYFHAEASHMQYSLPPLRHQDSRHGSGSSRARQLLGERFYLTWLGKELALVTHHGDWYRLSLDQSSLDEVSRTATCKVVEHRKLWRLDAQY